MTSKLGPSELMYRNSSKKSMRRAKESNASLYGAYSVTDAESNHYIPQNDDIMNNRYTTDNPCVVLGKGTFGVVIKALDTQTGLNVAVKVIRAQENYTYAANNEIRILKTLLRSDDSDTHVIPIIDHFVYAYHTCIVTPLLGMSLYDLNRSLGYRGFPYQFFKSCLLDIVLGTSHIHKNKLVHTDLKPENVLLENNRYLDTKTGMFNTSKAVPCKVIDLGSSQLDKKDNYALICTRQYRPPEVVCGLNWDRSADIWSIGCIAFELFTGTVLFNTHDSHEHMALIQKTIGPPPASFSVAASIKTPEYFTDSLEPVVLWPPIGGIPIDSKMDQMNAVSKVNDLEKRIESAALVKDVSASNIFSFISSCLKWNPAERLDATGLLNHPLFMGMYVKSTQSFIPLKSMATRRLREFDYSTSAISMLRYIVAVHNAVRDTNMFNLGRQAYQVLQQIEANGSDFDYSNYGSACMLFGQTREIINRDKTVSMRIQNATHVTDETILF